MGKFVIKCPREGCDKYVEVTGLFGTGFLASSRKKVKCSCGEEIEVQPNKLASRTCPNCGNNVVYDQSKGAKARCPVCHQPINTLEEQKQNVEFSCAQCGVRLISAKGQDTFTCPVCDCVNDVAERTMQEKIQREGLASIIKYEGDNSTFVWKHPIMDFNYGSQLIVHESQEAVFFRDGQALDLFGPGRYTLETQQLPLLEKVYKLPTNNEGTFHSEVYFINKTVQMGIKWGTPNKTRFIDPLTGVPLEIGASGELNLQVEDSRKLLVKLVGTMKGIAWGAETGAQNYFCEKCGQELYPSNAVNGAITCPNMECRHVNYIKPGFTGFSKSLQAAFRPMISNAVKSNLAAVIKNNEIDILDVDDKLDIISESLRQKVSAGFEEYGLTVPQLYVTNVVLPEDDPNFMTIRKLHAVSLETRKIQANAAIESAKHAAEAAIEQANREAVLQKEMTTTEQAKRQAERDILAAQVDAQKDRLAGLAEAEVMAAKGYNQRDVLQAEVQKAYAEGIGNMGSGGGSGTGGGGGGMMSDIMGLGVGMAAMGAIAPQIGNMLSGINPNAQAQQPAEPQPAVKQAEAPAAEGWTCPSCGRKDIPFKFCPDCGAKKPEPKPVEGWTCPSCGLKDIPYKFCPECGAKKPEPPAGWTCPSCGLKDITFKFCPECGAKKPEADSSWTCANCGTKDIKGNFCPECGNKKGE